MITVRAYEARCVWIFTGLGDESDYPGKIRALAAACADRSAIYCYSARRFVGLPAMLAELLEALWAVFPVLRVPETLATPPAVSLAGWPVGWALRPSDRIPARRTTGPPHVPTSADIPEAVTVISP